MTILNLGGIPTSLGEIISFKFYLDLVKNKYNQIKLGFHMPLLYQGLHTDTPNWIHRQQLWNTYLQDLGSLFFSQPPYILLPNTNTFYGNINRLINDLKLEPTLPRLSNILPHGTPLNIGEYIVITTKAREIDPKKFFLHSIKLWSTIKKLSQKYKVVILGERIVEMRKEYKNSNQIFGIYEQIIVNIPSNRIIDLTVPALGETVNTVKEIRQDCLIMKQAKFTITIGIGGNCCMSTASSTMAIGYRTDNDLLANLTYGKDYPNAIITKDWDRFINIMENYL
jgi:hypothetical protein